MRRHPNVVNVDEVSPFSPPNLPAPFGARAKLLAQEAGGVQLGCALFELPAGKTSVPLHAHHANEEAIYVLRGEATSTIGDAKVVVREGDWIALPAGEAHAHQMVADRGVDVAYLCVSTKHAVDVVTYPKSGKLLAVAGPRGAGLRHMFRRTDGNVDYFEGEREEVKP